MTIGWLSLRTLSSRWQVFVGTFLALMLGVALMATTLLCVAGTQVSDKQDDWLLAVAVTLLGNAAAVSGAAAIFVLVGTFSFAAARRRREFALLRAVGATPRQVRHLVMGEALIIGLAASVAGCVLGVVFAPVFASWMASVELAPAGFAPHITWWPLLCAAATGFVSAFASSWLAARRAGGVAPLEAFAEASIDRRTMTLLRWIGAAVFIVGAALVSQLVISKVHTGIGAAYVLLEILLLIFGITMLIPVFAPPLIRLMALPLRTAMGRLAKANTVTSLRRTSSLIAPIFITMSLAAAALSSVATLAGIHSRAAEQRISAPLVAAPSDAKKGLERQAVSALDQAAEQSKIEPVSQGSVSKVQASTKDRDRLTVWYVRPTIGQAVNLPVTAGDISALTSKDTAVVDDQTATSQGWSLNQTIQLWLPNGTSVSQRIVAIMQSGTDMGATVLLPESLRPVIAPDLTPQLAYIVPTTGSNQNDFAARLQPIAQAHNATVQTVGDFLAAQNKQDARVDQVALFTVVGLAVVYTALSIANTCIMATTGRFRDFAVLRLSGATNKQVLVMVTIETFLAAAVAAVAAAVVTLAALLIIQVNPATPQIVMPWAHILTAGAACLGIALAASIISTVWAFRTPAIRVAAARE